MEVIIPFVMALLIDEGVEKGDMNKILLYGIIMIVLAMISLFGRNDGRQICRKRIIRALPVI